MRGDVGKVLMGMVWTALALAIASVILYMPASDGMHYCTDHLFVMTSLLLALSMPFMLMKSGMIKWGLVDVILLAITALYCVSALVSDSAVFPVLLQEAFPYFCLYISVKVFISTGDKMAEKLLIVILGISLVCEAFIALSQVFGYRISGHASFGMTGSFSNPGPFGGYIAIVLSVISASLLGTRFWSSKTSDAGRFRSIVICFLLVVLFLGVIVLPASRSRAGWLALAMSLLLYGFVEGNLWKWLREHKIHALLSLIVAAVLLVGAFYLKKDSAIGRFHIWNIELRAIAANPLIGTGPGTALGAYGAAQESFFRNNVDYCADASYAGCPEYAFNEFLKVGMETGAAGVVLALLLVIFSVISLFRQRSALAYGLVSVVVFSLFSYPLSVVRLSVLIVVILAVSSCSRRVPVIAIPSFVVLLSGILLFRNEYHTRAEVFTEWKNTRHMVRMELYDDSVEALMPLYDELFWNYNYLYDLGYSLHKAGHYSRSNDILKQGISYSSDPMFHNIMGKNYEALRIFEEAENEYIKSLYMVPCRLYPMVLLMEMYHSQGRTEELLDMGRRIIAKPVNPGHIGMQNLRERAISDLRDWGYWGNEISDIMTGLTEEGIRSIRRKYKHDELKLKAAEFILDNIGYNYFLYSDQLDQAKHWYRFMRERPQSELRHVRDSLMNEIGQVSPMRIIGDVDRVDADYICDNIDMAFKVWKEQPWGKNVDFELFCEYILPYKIADEVPEYWRREYYEKYNPLLDEFRQSDEYDREDPVEALRFLLGKLPFVYDPIYTSESLIPFPHVGPRFVRYVTGSCREFSDFVIYVCRALGIPCAFNETYNMHRCNQGHHWASFWNKNKEEYMISNYPPVVVPNRSDYTLGTPKCKVYRASYSLNRELFGRGSRNRRALKYWFQIPKYDDVTRIYTNRYIPEFVFPSDSIHGDIALTEPVYICSSARMGWVPEDFAFKSLRGLSFSRLQTGEVVCICRDNGGSMIPLGRPFMIDSYTHQLHFFVPEDSLEQVTCKVKFPVSSEEQMFRDRLVGGVFEVSATADFSDVDTLFVISDAPERRCTRVSVDDEGMDYRYVRYKGPDGAYCNIAEVTYFNHEGDTIRPVRILGTKGSDFHDFPNVYDGSSLTSFNYPHPYGGWSGIELEKGTRINAISYTPRNRDNFINDGDVYELLYYDDNWRSLGVKRADADTLVYDNVPDGALLLLRNHSGGVQERIFTFENGKQIWR